MKWLQPHNVRQIGQKMGKKSTGVAHPAHHRTTAAERRAVQAQITAACGWVPKAKTVR